MSFPFALHSFCFPPLLGLFLPCKAWRDSLLTTIPSLSKSCQVNLPKAQINSYSFKKQKWKVFNYMENKIESSWTHIQTDFLMKLPTGFSNWFLTNNPNAWALDTDQNKQINKQKAYSEDVCFVANYLFSVLPPFT